MRRELFSVAVLLAVVLASGCTSTERQAPAVQRPIGPVLGALTALNSATDYLDSVYAGSVIIVPFTLTRKLQGTPCAWDGEGAGNATRWMMVFEAIVASGGFGRHVTVAVTVEYRGGKVGVKHAPVQSTEVNGSDADRVMDEIDNLSLASNISFDSHYMFLKADPQKWALSADLYYLQSITMTLYDASTSPHGSAVPTWEIEWKYIARDGYRPAVSTVVLDAADGALIKVVPPP